MSYAIDLNERQSARTLEQAIRHQARVVLEPRIWPAEEAIRCQLEACERPAGQGRRVYSAPLVVVADLGGGSKPPGAEVGPAGRAADLALVEKYNVLIGTYCDAILELGENRYLFSTDVTRVEPSGPIIRGVRIYLTRPEVIQVAQRRRFRRIQLPQAAQVEIRWKGEDGSGGGGIGWLYNIGQEGLACRVDSALADRLWIGQEIKIGFSLRPAELEHYALDAVICNKTPAGTPDRTILGMQFLSGAGHEASGTMQETLRRRLRAIAGSPAGVRKGVDA
jgi:hypothetical protein